MENIEKILQKIQNDLTQQKLEFKQLEDNITKRINENTNEKFEKINQKTQEIEQKLEKQELKLEFLERQLNKKNIIFFGLEKENEKHYQELEKKIVEFLKDKLRITCDNTELESIRRLGKKGDNPRPIAVTFTTLGKKIQILNNKKLLDETSYYIKEDFSKKVLEKRKSLQDELKRLRNEGKRAVLKFDKIIILNNKPIEQEKRLNNKRNLSESPVEKQTPSNNQLSKQISKKNKPDISDYMIRQQNQSE